MRTCYLITSFCLSLLTNFDVQAQPYETSIASTDFDFITDSDPSIFQHIEFIEHAQREMPDSRPCCDDSLFKQAYVFEAFYANGTVVELAIDAAFGSQAAALQEANRYVTRLGKVPEVLLRGVQRVVVHEGGADGSFFSDIGLLVFYEDKATQRINNHDLEESLFHESVHAAWDALHANSAGWRAAQNSDPDFITSYAKNNPSREDLAESALFAYTILRHPERFPADDAAIIRSTMPARIDYIEALLSESVGGSSSSSSSANSSGSGQPVSSGGSIQLIWLLGTVSIAGFFVVGAVRKRTHKRSIARVA